MIAAAEVGVDARRQHLREHPHRRAAALHPPHEARVAIAAGVGQHVAQELGVHGGQLGRRIGRRRVAIAAPELGRDRRPGRLVAQAREVVEHVVEHGVALATQRLPIERVEGRMGRHWQADLR